MSLLVVRNDITRVKADAVVNTANKHVCVGDGVDMAIYQAAGMRALLRERKKIGEIAAGECVPTSAFGLSAKYILHTVGMPWQGGKAGEEDVLRSCYRKSLQMAAALHCKSVALPLLASGSFGYPKELALRIAQEEINRFLAKKDMQIILTVYDAEALLLSQEIFDDIQDYLQNEYQPQNNQSDDLRERDYYRREVRHEKSLDDLLSNNQESFSAMVLRLTAEKGLKPTEVYTAANLDRKIFSKLKRNKSFHPNKLTAISLAVGLKLSYADTQRLLARAGYTLSNGDKFDVIIRYCLEHDIYEYMKINLILDEYGLEGIGQRVK